MDRVSDIAASPTAIDIQSATCASNVSGVHAVAFSPVFIVCPCCCGHPAVVDVLVIAGVVANILVVARRVATNLAVVGTPLCSNCLLCCC